MGCQYSLAGTITYNRSIILYTLLANRVIIILSMELNGNGRDSWFRRKFEQIRHFITTCLALKVIKPADY